MDHAQANVQARKAFTFTLARGEAQQVALTAAEAELAMFGHLYKGPGMPTVEDCREALAKVFRHFGIDEMVALNHRFGISKVEDLWIGLYRSFVEFANATIEHNVPPSASWLTCGDSHLPVPHQAFVEEL